MLSALIDEAIMADLDIALLGRRHAPSDITDHYSNYDDDDDINDGSGERRVIYWEDRAWELVERAYSLMDLLRVIHPRLVLRSLNNDIDYLERVQRQVRGRIAVLLRVQVLLDEVIGKANGPPEDVLGGLRELARLRPKMAAWQTPVLVAKLDGALGNLDNRPLDTVHALLRRRLQDYHDGQQPTRALVAQLVDLNTDPVVADYLRTLVHLGRESTVGPEYMNARRSLLQTLLKPASRSDREDMLADERHLLLSIFGSSQRGKDLVADHLRGLHLLV